MPLSRAAHRSRLPFSVVIVLSSMVSVTGIVRKIDVESSRFNNSEESGVRSKESGVRSKELGVYALAACP